MHGRPAAFEGLDGRSYSVDLAVDETGDPARPFGGYFVYVRWSAGEHPALEGHVESPFVTFGMTEAEAMQAVSALPLSAARAALERRLADG